MAFMMVSLSYNKHIFWCIILRFDVIDQHRVANNCEMKKCVMGLKCFLTIENTKTVHFAICYLWLIEKICILEAITAEYFLLKCVSSLFQMAQERANWMESISIS